MTSWWRVLLLAAVAFAAAIAGVVAGRAMLPAQSQTGAELHTVLHGDLDLDAAQKARIETIERSFAIRRRTLELELRTDNAKLAAAIEAEHGFGPQVSASIDASHVAMGELQKETLAHVFAMRAILRPAQTAKFDAAVVKALTADLR